jgi:hypothetical protein
MRWLQAGLGVLALIVAAGCPSEFGKEGRIAKAIHEDTADMVIKRCSEEWRDKVCAPGKEASPKCLECGGPKK